jgi:hypothetical protein
MSEQWACFRGKSVSLRRQEQTYRVSPYAYCAGDPVNYVDSEGEKIIFVNGYLKKRREINKGNSIGEILSFRERNRFSKTILFISQI